jgi:hypothetical protein
MGKARMKTWNYRLVIFFWINLYALDVAYAQKVADSTGTTGAIAAPTPSTGAAVRVRLQLADRSGNPLPTPSKGQLRLSIGGKQVQIDEIRSLKDEPLFFSMVVDMSGSTREYGDRQAEIALKLFRALSTGENHGYLIRFGDKVEATEHWVALEDVEQALKVSRRWGSSPLYDSIAEACSGPMRSDRLPAGARRAIFVIADGEDNASNHSLKWTIRAAQKEGVPIFPILVSLDPESSKYARKKAFETLKQLGDQTGGLFTNPGPQGEMIANYANFLQWQSLVEFRVDEIKTKKEYPLKAEWPDMNVQVLIPAEYIAP